MVSRLSMPSTWLQPFLGQSCTTLRDIQSQTSSSQNDFSIWMGPYWTIPYLHQDLDMESGYVLEDILWMQRYLSLLHLC